MNPVAVTHHSTVRARERLRWDAHTLERMAARAFNIGRAKTEFSGNFRRWLETRSVSTDTGEELTLRVYGSDLYLFGKGRLLVTLFQIPSEFRKYLR